MGHLSEVQQFYQGKNVMITGATGFFGKLLIEKLLRACPGIKKLYLLIREKKEKDIFTRFGQILDDPVFSRLRQELPNFKEKIILVRGDCFEPDLGISLCDKQKIVDEVNIIFHLAATLKFNEHLRIALNSNVRATLDLFQLAKTVRNLEVFMYISTAFSNASLPAVEEKFYGLHTDYEQLLEVISYHTNEEVEKMLPKILGPWPNTYTFTKAVAEKEILAQCGETPVGIFRPAIVISTAKEPIKNWIDNLYGPTGFVVGCGTGVLRTIQCDGSTTAEIIPADLAVNCLITAALDVHRAYTRSFPPSQPLIYNYVSSVENKITWKDFKTYAESNYNEYPFSKAIWYRSLELNKNRIIHFIYVLMLHLIPATIVDGVRLLEMKKPKYLKMYKKIHDFSSIFAYFATKNIKFCNKHTRTLWKNTSDLDKQLFQFSMAEFNWDEYFKGYTLGIRRYLLQEKDEDLPKARMKLKRLYYVDLAVKLCVVLLFLILFYKIIF